MVCGSVWYSIWFAVRTGKMWCKTKSGGYLRKSVRSEVVNGIEKETSVSNEHNALSKIVLALGESGDDDGWQRRPWILGRTSLLAQRNNTQHIGKSNVSMYVWIQIKRLGWSTVSING
jgi:hypothetical protein